MTLKLTRRARLGLGVAALAVVASGLPFAGSVLAAPTGPTTITPAGVKSSGDTYQLNVPGGSTCPGDATPSGGNYRWTTYIAPVGNDLDAMTFAPITGLPSGAGFTSALRNPAGGLVQAQTSLGIGTGLIALPAGGVSLSFAAIPVPAGDYNIGIACTQNQAGTIVNTKYWNTTATFLAATGAGPQNFIWGDEDVAGAPTISTTTASAVVPSINYSIPPAIGAVTELIATVTPTSPAGPALPVISVPIGSQAFPATTGSFNIPGLTLGTTYSVTVEAENSVGSSPVSNLVPVTPSNATPPPPVATGVDGTGFVRVNWTAPPSGPAPIGYTVNISGQPALNLGTVLTTGDVPLPPGNYTATVTAVYDASEFIAGVPSNEVALRSFDSTLIEQEITFTRPQLNALILTQRCGVNGALDAEPADANRFPRSIDALAASADQVGTFPTGDTQANFDEYPVPSNPVYPTRCGIALANVQLVTSGPLSGQYFTASGALNQVTVADFRDVDAGWTLTGTMGDFTSGSNSFSGNYLGWTPATPIVSPPTGDGYVQTVSPGAQVIPGDGVGTFGGTGLASGRTLASAPIGTPTAGGTGIADMNARVKLLIPTTANSGDYSGILTFTVA